MCLFMKLEAFRLGKRSFTETAIVDLLPGVYSFVCFEKTFISEGFAASLAFERLNAVVCFLVIVEFSTNAKRQPTNWANEWLFPDMSLLVCAKWSGC